MKLIKGNSSAEVTRGELVEIIDHYNEIHVDFGTGDGRLPYKLAKENPQNLYIGVDPSHKQLEEYSKKANKERLSNVVFVVGSVEQIPHELEGLATFMYVYLPWGSLLESIAKPIPQNLKNLVSVLSDGGRCEIIFGYSQTAEPTETQRLGLENLNLHKIETKILTSLQNTGAEIVEYGEVSQNELKRLETTWAKKLAFGQDRPLFRIVFDRKCL